MNSHRRRIPMDQPAIYKLQVQGLINQSWLEYFDELHVTVEGEDGWAVTTLTGLLQDQAALQGLLQKLYSLGMVLLRAERKDEAT